MGITMAAVGGALASGAVTAVITWWLSRARERAEIGRLRAERARLAGAAQQAHADAAAAITAAATTLLQPLRDRVDHLERLVGQQRTELAQLRPLREEVDRLRAENASLRAQLRALRTDLETRHRA